MLIFTLIANDALSSASLAIEKSGTTEIPESFWGNDIKF